MDGRRLGALALAVALVAGVAAIAAVGGLDGRNGAAAPAPSSLASLADAPTAPRTEAPSSEPATAAPADTSASPSPSGSCATFDDVRAAFQGFSPEPWSLLQSLGLNEIGVPLTALVSTPSGVELAAIASSKTQPYAADPPIDLHGDMRLSWSPDGTRLALGVSDDCGRQDVFVLSDKGLDRPAAWGPEGQTAVDVAWSPDSSRLATLQLASAGWPPLASVRIVGFDGGTPSVLPPLPCRDCGFAAPIRWSPDGQWLAAAIQQYRDAGDRAGVAVIHVSKPGKPVVQSWRVAWTGSLDALEWSDGHTLLMTRQAAEQKLALTIDARASTLRPRSIAQVSLDILGLVPGTMDAVTLDQGTRSNANAVVVSLLDLKTGHRRPLWRVPPAVASYVRLLAIGPYGAALAFETGGGPGAQHAPGLWIVPVDGGKAHQLDATVLAAAWRRRSP
jgi:hypothetical protein